MWWESIVLLLAAGGTVYGLVNSVMEGNKRLRAWQDAAMSCDLLIVQEAAFTLSPRLKARAGLVEVRIETGGEKGRLTRISIVGPAPPEFPSIKIRPESPFHFAREIEIGDPDFDSAFFIEGPPRLVFALLDAETRRLLAHVSAESRLALSYGELRAELADEKVTDILPLLLDIRKRFAPASEIARCLVDNARKDPKAGVRLQNLLLLIREFPEAPGTLAALRAACSDPSPEIRLRAARELGTEAHGVLLDLAEKLEDDAVSAEALSILDRELPFERARAILNRAVSRRGLRTAKICLEAFGRSGAAAVDTLATVLKEEYGELASAAAEALGATGSPAAEPSLIQALEREDAGVRAAAAEALGRVGTATAVPALKEAAERWHDRELRRAARQAVAEIQARLQGAAPGQLSLAQEGGELSLSQEGGELSFADDPGGRLSLPEERPE